MQQTLPTFIGIGAQRAGTTWLHHCLREHPEIFMPEKKEQRFFNYNWEKGLEHYSESFSDAQGYEIRGEITPDYYRQPEALRRISNTLPEVKLILLLRNPIERAYSQYELYSGTEYERMSFRDTHLAHPELVNWGLYGQHLAMLLTLFSRDQILIRDYSLISNSPKALLQDVYDFVGASRDFTPDSLTRSYNKVILPRTQAAIRKLGLSGAIDGIKASSYGDLIRRFFRKRRQGLSRADYETLAPCFEADIQRLGELLGTDFTHWLRYE
jgi:hypothetical protein